MTFEDTIIFYNPEHADEFAQNLKKAGFKAKTKRISTLVKQTICTGKIDDFVSLFSEEKKKYENGEEQSDVSSLMSDMYSEIIEELTLRKKRLMEFFGSVNPGDLISDLPGFKDWCSWSRDGTEDLSADSDEKRGNITMFHLLNENDLLENSDAGWILKYSKEPKDIITAIPSDMVIEASSAEKRSKYNINTIINVMSGIETHVILPAEFSIVAEPGIIDEIIEKYDVDEESIWRLKENGYIKSMLAEKIIDHLKENERTPFDELFEEIKNLEITTENSCDEFRFDLDEKFLKDMLNDLKKMNLIKSKGNHFRPA